MYIDKSLTFSNAQAVTATAASTDYIDLGSARQIGLAKQLFVLFTVNTTTVSAGATTMTIKIQTDGDVAFGSAADLYTSASIAKATLVAGYQIAIPIPISGMERYVRLYYTVSTADFSAGAFSAAIVEGLQANTAYPDAL
jgi:hypothetical protein